MNEFITCCRIKICCQFVLLVLFDGSLVAMVAKAHSAPYWRLRDTRHCSVCCFPDSSACFVLSVAHSNNNVLVKLDRI